MTVERVRLDKWLWAARFFKTRQLATEAINGGKVHLNGQRSKPGKELKVGSLLRIHTPAAEYQVVVRVLAEKRRPATEARTFYEETPESQAQRAKLAEVRKVERMHNPHHRHGRMNKKERRQIHRFTGKGN